MFKDRFVIKQNHTKVNNNKISHFFCNNKKIVILTSIIFILIATVTTTFAMQHYQKVDFSTGFITATQLNVRQGPRNKLQNTNNS